MAARKPAPKKAPAKKAALAAEYFVRRRELLPVQPVFGWTPEDIMTAVESFDRGQFRQAEALYAALTKDPRIGPALESRANALRRLPFSLRVRRDAPQAVKDAAELLQENWTECVSETDRSQIVKRVIMFGFCVGRLKWTLKDGQLIFSVTPWTHSSLWYDWGRRGIYGLDETGKEVRIQDDGQEWIVFSKGGERPWLDGDLRKLGRLYFLESFFLDRLAAYCDTQGQAIKGVKTPALKRESEEVKKLWAIVDQLRGGDSVLLPEGFDLKLIESGADGFRCFIEGIEWVDRSYAIVLLGHSLSQETTGKSGTWGATRAAIVVTAELTTGDVSLLSGPLSRGPLRTWCRVNFTPSLYPELRRPLISYAPTAFWDTSELADKAAAAATALTTAQATSTFLAAAQAAGAKIDELKIDWATLAERCGLPLQDRGIEQAGDLDP